MELQLVNACHVRVRVERVSAQPVADAIVQYMKPRQYIAVAEVGKAEGEHIHVWMNDPQKTTRAFRTWWLKQYPQFDKTKYSVKAWTKNLPSYYMKGDDVLCTSFTAGERELLRQVHQEVVTTRPTRRMPASATIIAEVADRVRGVVDAADAQHRAEGALPMLQHKVEWPSLVTKTYISYCVENNIPYDVHRANANIVTILCKVNPRYISEIAQASIAASSVLKWLV